MLTHIDKFSNPQMVDVSDKAVTSRTAVASGKITMNEAAFIACRDGSGKKGAVISTAVVAGVMAAKNTAQIIPMCHPLMLSKVNIELTPLEAECGYLARSEVKNSGQTGVEMEALTAVSVALLTVYDMLKAVDKTMQISDIKLLEKTGGKSGQFKRD